jgi:hypothetical protein
MTPADEAREISTRYPLPDHVELQEPFVESVDVNGAVVHTVGFAVQAAGECITGSAGSLLAPPVVRAYMELLERLTIASLSNAAQAPESTPTGSASWRPARSNGVALGTSFEDAAHRATLELIERDRVLRSWYGGAAPRSAELGSLVPNAFLQTYAFEACLFEDVQGVSTAGVFGFPRGDAPLVHGFAARDDSRSAIEAALEECLQRLGFLWGEAIPTEAPAPAPTPSFHQEHYLFPANHDALRRWLRGENTGLSGCLNAGTTICSPVLEELRPAWLPASLSVVRANPRGHVPLGFGVGHPLMSRALPLSQSVHPVV